MKQLNVAVLVDSDIVGSLRKRKTTTVRALYDLSVVEMLGKTCRSVHLVGVKSDSLRWLEELGNIECDMVFNLALSAQPFEEAVPGCLDLLGMPYTGSGPLGIALSNDKVRSKMLLRAAGVCIPDFVEIVPGAPCRPDFRPPYIVKPRSLGGSAGIHADSVVETPAEARALAKRIWRKFEVSALCEQFIVGRELRAFLIQDAKGVFRVAAVTQEEIGSARPGWGFKTEALKASGKVRRANRVSSTPIALPARQMRELSSISHICTQTLAARDYATLDLRIDSLGRMHVLELNANPGLWSGAPGWSQPSFEANMRKILNSAARRSAAF